MEIENEICWELCPRWGNGVSEGGRFFLGIILLILSR